MQNVPACSGCARVPPWGGTRGAVLTHLYACGVLGGSHAHGRSFLWRNHGVHVPRDGGRAELLELADVLEHCAAQRSNEHEVASRYVAQ